MNVSATKSAGGEGSEGVMATVIEEEGEEPGEVEDDKSDNEEAICPICLNELDEGEDLLVCSSCHNHLHQHCMDICKWVEFGVGHGHGHVIYFSDSHYASALLLIVRNVFCTFNFCISQAIQNYLNNEVFTIYGTFISHFTVVLLVRFIS